MASNKKNQFKKIQQFVTEQYNHVAARGIVVVKLVDNQYRVNNYTIKETDNTWNITNEAGKVVYNLFNKRLAILLAALLSKKKIPDIVKVTSIDRQLDIFLADKTLFSYRYKKNPTNTVYGDRLSRVEKELGLLEEQIRDLEKSVLLQ